MNATHVTEEIVKGAADAAEDAFWAAVVAYCEQHGLRVVSGDFPWDVSADMEEKSRAYVRLWMQWNTEVA